MPKNQVKTSKAPISKPPRLQKPQDALANTHDHVFRYDFDNKNNNLDNASSTTYSNLPSPTSEENANSVPTIHVPAPPLVFRELKPGRKTSDSNISVELSPSLTHKDINTAESIPFEPPSINRKLKPPMAKPTVDGKKNSHIAIL